MQHSHFWRATNDKQTTIVWPSCLLPYPSAKEAWIVLASAQDSSAEWEDLAAFTFLAPNWTTPLLNKRVWPSFLYNSLSLTQDSSTGWEDLALSGTWRIINQSCPQAISASLDLWYVYWSHPHYRITERLSFTAERETDRLIEGGSNRRETDRERERERVMVLN